MPNVESNWRTATKQRTRAPKRWQHSARFQVEELEARTLLQGGTWTTLTNLIPDPEGGQHMILLSNGTIMVQGGDNLTNETTANRWYALTPTATGSYVNGTWSTLASMSIQRAAFGSAVLPDGRLLIVGGEDSGNPIAMNETNTGEIYNPLTNTWSPIANFPQPEFGDNNLEVLQNGTVLAGYLNGPQTYIYHPTTNTWTFAANLLNGDTSGEETWVKLPDGSILSYQIQGSQPQTAERYIPSLNEWVFAGNVPVNLSSDGGNNTIVPELGPGFMLPDGRSFWLGASNHTALYTPPTTLLGTGSWVAGPDIPNNLGLFDGPGCVMPNGDVLFLASPQDGTNFAGPTHVFEYDPSTNAILGVAVPAALQTDLNNGGTLGRQLIVLPSGQVMLTNTDTKIWVFTPNGSPQNAWRPRITKITNNGNGTFTLTGQQLNGLDEGSLEGDDNQNATNYPIVRITDDTGKVFYCADVQLEQHGRGNGQRHGNHAVRPACRPQHHHRELCRDSQWHPFAPVHRLKRHRLLPIPLRLQSSEWPV